MNRTLHDLYGFDVPASMAFSLSDELYVVTFQRILVFNENGFVRQFGAIPSILNDISFDSSGNGFVSGFDIYKLNSAGTLLQSWTPARETDQNQFGWIDLASDQCTLHYGGRGRIFRFNVCTGVQLPDIQVTPTDSLVEFTRILQDGSFLSIQAGAIYLRDAGGSTLRVFDVAGVDLWSRLALDPDRSSFWATQSGNAASPEGQLFRFDLSSGSVVAGPFNRPYLVFALTVFGEPRAAIVNAAAIPTLSQWVLIVLALSVAAVGYLKIR